MTKQTPGNTVYDGVETTRHFVEETTDVARRTTEYGMKMSRQMLDIWAATADANLKAAFELQNAAITAGRSLAEAAGGNNVPLYEQWADMVRRAQQATLDAWQAGRKLSGLYQPPPET